MLFGVCWEKPARRGPPVVAEVLAERRGVRLEYCEQTSVFKADGVAQAAASASVDTIAWNNEGGLRRCGF